ncbi:hypothetical protein STEG23_002101, partial [Scotinomys teguina]
TSHLTRCFISVPGEEEEVRNPCERGGRKIVRARWMTPRKQYLPETTDLVCVRTHRDCGSMYRICTVSAQMASILPLRGNRASKENQLNVTKEVIIRLKTNLNVAAGQ